MKKTGLFKILIGVLLAIIVLSWFIPVGYFQNGEIVQVVDGDHIRLGFFDFFQLLFGTFKFETFVSVFIFILCVGAFYGVVSKTGKYRAWIDKISTSFNGKEGLFLVLVAIILTLLSSFLGYGMILFIFIPFLIGIILSLGYDKITAFIATFGSILIGQIGSTLSYNTTGIINESLAITTYNQGLVYRAILLAVLLALLCVYLISAKKSKLLRAEKKIENLLVDDVTSFTGEKVSNKYSVAPIIVIFILLFVL